ncbi:MAG: hypothetical protein ACFE85_15120 [Candidatus Hodarchaeota archaeon]
MMNQSFDNLLQFLKKIPSITGSIGYGVKEGLWWVKFRIDIDHSLAWNVIQELGYILNYLSLEERLQTIFMPISPPPYMNGGPNEFLSWIIESKSKDFTPDDAKEWLKNRLPDPVNKIKKWKT